MIRYIIIPFAIVLFFNSCEKAADSNAAAATTTGTGGSLARFTIAGNYLYLVDVSSLKTYDITDPEKPVEQPVLYLNGFVETIFPYKDKLFIGSRNGMFIYSISNPAKPVLLGTASHVRSCDPVVANDSIAFVTLLGGRACGPAQDGLYIHNIKDLTKPVLIKNEPIPTPNGLGLADSILYVCQKANGMSIYDVSKPATPLFRKKINTYTFEDVIPYNNLLICYISTGLVLYDISNRTNPVELNVINN
jgi:hypothetical protein